MSPMNGLRLMFISQKASERDGQSSPQWTLSPARLGFAAATGEMRLRFYCSQQIVVVVVVSHAESAGLERRSPSLLHLNFTLCALGRHYGRQASASDEDADDQDDQHQDVQPRRYAPQVSLAERTIKLMSFRHEYGEPLRNHQSRAEPGRAAASWPAGWLLDSSISILE